MSDSEQRCGTCRHFNADLGEIDLPRFGRCKFLPTWDYISAWRGYCRFSPSRYEASEAERAGIDMTKRAAK